MLRMGHAATKSPGTTSETASPVKQSGNAGVAIDTDALQRQQQHVQAGMNGSTDVDAAIASTPGQEFPNRVSHSEASPTRGGTTLKRETSSHKSPSLGAVGASRLTPGSSGSDQHARALDDAALMPPPPRSLTPRRVNGNSPHPPHAGGHIRNQHPLSASQQPASPFETKWRAPGKGNPHSMFKSLRNVQLI